MDTCPTCNRPKRYRLYTPEDLKDAPFVPKNRLWDWLNRWLVRGSRRGMAKDLAKWQGRD